MKIRAITLFTDVESDVKAAQIEPLGKFARAARQAYQADGFEVQTTRLATRLPPDYGPAEQLVEFAASLEETCQAYGFEYVSLGPLGREFRKSLPDLLRATRSLFATINLTRPGNGAMIDGDAVRDAARVMRQAATVEAGGFANLRFAALANVPPLTPFFPAAYHAGGPPAFAIATESADLAVRACADAGDAATAGQRLTLEIERHAQRLGDRAVRLSQEHDFNFGGIDFSLAPFPTPEISIGAALESLGGRPLGSAGSLAAAAVLTNAIDQARFPRCGFCGLMLPVLEDTGLANSVAHGHVHVSDLLQWSALCGTGLDTVPLPGDVDEDTVSALLFDVAALSTRLKKPLSARLMPIPGKVAGDLVHFDFAYFTDSRVLAPGKSAPGPLGSTTELRLSARSS